MSPTIQPPHTASVHAALKALREAHDNRREAIRRQTAAVRVARLQERTMQRAGEAQS